MLSPDNYVQNPENTQNYNRYSYCMNNPLKYVDPSGENYGNYYDIDGKYIGTDGVDDKKVYVVTNKKEAKTIRNANKEKTVTSADKVNSKVELPSFELRSEMSKVVEMDKENSFREYGGVFGLTNQGEEHVFWANPGQKATPPADASIDLFDFANENDRGLLGSSAYGTFHSHPSGTIYGKVDINTIGKTGIDKVFEQTPSQADLDNAARRSSFVTGNSYVFGTGNGTVYIYNGSGTIATFPIKSFRTVR